MKKHLIFEKYLIFVLLLFGCLSLRSSTVTLTTGNLVTTLETSEGWALETIPNIQKFNSRTKNIIGALIKEIKKVSNRTKIV